MRSNRTPEARPRGGGALFLLVLLLALLAWREAPPAPRAATAPPTEFSGQRAGATLERLLGDGTPHPLGSPANAAVRERLLAELAALGLAGEVERDWACSDEYGVCGEVANVLARLPAAGSGPAVLLVAHYDSVPAGPGGSDDGSGVVVLLETARALLAGPPLARPVWLLFTEGEEMGLLGAEAFVRGPHLAEVGVVLNAEALGASGLAWMFETGEANRELAALLGRHARRPVASSLAVEVYRRMPNNTDFSVFRRAGLTGLNFAFVGEPLVYHTPLDTAARCARGSLQHEGDQLLALTRALAAAPALPVAPGRAVFFDLAGFLLIRWPESWSLPLALAALLLLGGQAVVRRRGARGLLGGLLGPPVALVAGGLLGWLLHRALTALGAFPAPWTATLGLARWAFVVLGLAAAALLGSLLARWSGWGLWLGTWLLWALGGLALAHFVPGASYLGIAPALVAALAGWAGRGESPPRAVWLLPLAAAALVWLPGALRLPDTMGYATLPALAAVAAWVGAAALGPFGAGRGGLRAGLLALVAVGLSVALLVRPAFTPHHPRGLALEYVETAAAAHWSAAVALPPAVRAAGEFAPGRPWPWVSSGGFSAPAPRLALPAPVVAIETIEPVAGGRRIRLALRSERGAPLARLWLPAGVELRGATVAGVALSPPPARRGVRGTQLAIATLPPAGVEIELELGGTEPVTAWVADASQGLPAAGRPLQEARGPAAVPVHRGDQTVVARELTL